MSKLLASIKEAIEKCELRDGMTISFHHHMRNGDYVLNMVLDEIAKMGIKDLTVNASSVFDVHEPIIGHIKNGVVTGIECNYMGGKVGKAISEGIMDKPVIFRSHGGRASDMEKGTSVIDVAFIAAPTADDMGNCTGKVGKSACGSIGYDAMNAKKVVVITDNLVEYPLVDFSIPEVYVDYVVAVDQIGNPAGIVSGTTKITRDPVGLKMASYAAKVIEASGLLLPDRCRRCDPGYCKICQRHDARKGHPGQLWHGWYHRLYGRYAGGRLLQSAAGRTVLRPEGS